MKSLLICLIALMTTTNAGNCESLTIRECENSTCTQDCLTLTVSKDSGLCQTENGGKTSKSYACNNHSYSFKTFKSSDCSGGSDDEKDLIYHVCTKTSSGKY